MNQYVTIFACGAKGGTQISLVILNQGNKHHHYSLVMCDIRKQGCFTDARNGDQVKGDLFWSTLAEIIGNFFARIRFPTD